MQCLFGAGAEIAGQVAVIALSFLGELVGQLLRDPPMRSAQPTEVAQPASAIVDAIGLH